MYFDNSSTKLYKNRIETRIIKKKLKSIREYGSTLYVGMARKKNGRPCISIASDELKSLVIYTHKFLYTHACLYLVFL